MARANNSNNRQYYASAPSNLVCTSEGWPRSTGSWLHERESTCHWFCSIRLPSVNCFAYVL